MTDLTLGPMSQTPDLRRLNLDDAVEAVVNWFFANFEDPAEFTPWDEGEYVYIWGGPYDAREEILDVFGWAIHDDVVNAAVERIEQDGWEWAPCQSRICEDMPGE